VRQTGSQKKGVDFLNADLEIRFGVRAAESFSLSTAQELLLLPTSNSRFSYASILTIKLTQSVSAKRKSVLDTFLESSIQVGSRSTIPPSNAQQEGSDQSQI
jgi:hypothetical protein